MMIETVTFSRLAQTECKIMRTRLWDIEHLIKRPTHFSIASHRCSLAATRRWFGRDRVGAEVLKCVL